MRVPNYRTTKEIVSFGIVGATSTFTHVSIAWLAFDLAGLSPIISNLAGAVCAFFLSFGGNAALTFSPTPVLRSGPRYLVASFVSFLLATAVMAIVKSKNLPTLAYAITVIAIVPPTTFVLAKFWVFAEPKRGPFKRDVGQS